MSLGVDQSWRQRAVDALEMPPGGAALDVATGTGDLAIRIAEHTGASRVVGLDPSRRMLAIARRKVDSRGVSIELVHGRAEALPFEDRTFDGVSIAFGIRNVPDRASALREMARVARRRIVVLELSEPRSGLLGPIARFHVHRVVPWLGSLLSGAREYRYLERSIAAFPPPDELAALMRASGMRVVLVRPLAFGACSLFVGEPVRSA
jgi:demethylmenaquinone methyltransferase/2-methoxy-6-polyprenyl-1,4-benzoquinol methylase